MQGLSAHGVFAAATVLPAPSVPSPAGDAPVGCGALGGLPLGPRTFVLPDRLTVRPLAGARFVSLWSGRESEPGPVSSVLNTELGDEWITIASDELFATAGLDVVAQVRADAEERFPDSDLTRHDGLGEGLEALRVVPRTLGTTPAVLVLALYVISPDRTLQVISFYISQPAAQDDREACLALALRSARTLRAGSRALEVGQPVALQVGRHLLHMTPPAGGLVVTEGGEESQFHRFYDLLPLGSPRVSGTLSFGRHVGTFATAPTESHPLVGAPATFERTEPTPGTVRLDLTEQVGDLLDVHVSLESRAGAPFEPWLRVLGEARFQP